jgi:hypothetical protein
VRRYVAVVAMMAVLVACGDGDGPAGETADAESDRSLSVDADDEAAGVDDDTTEADDGDLDGTSSPEPAGEPLRAAEHPLQEQGGTLEIELRAREVGELLRVAVTFTPRGIGDERTSIATLFGSAGSGNGISGRLIDPVNLLEYETVRPAVPHGQSTPAYEDQPTTLHFYFAAPVEELETFDFLLDFGVGVPDWPGFVDVPFGAS